ncbi:MAG: hypothetical protein HY293_00435 [Planctomycetes bacterium]|nr:hypothetical protein [Planctomycetota bacterium]
MTTTCPACGKTTPAHLALCVFCGKVTTGMIKCPKCSREAGPLATKCLYCDTPLSRDPATVLPPPPPPPAAAPPPPAPSLQARGMAEADAVVAREIARDMHQKQRLGLFVQLFQIALFVLAIPVLVPALLMTFIMTKRWGRIPMTFIFIDGGALFLIGIGTDFRGGTSTFLGMSAFTWLMFLGLGSAVLLTVIRTAKGKIEQGILMGYSNLVVMLLIFGGAIFLWGFLRLTWRKTEPPGGPVIAATPTVVSPQEALKLTGPELPYVRLKNSMLDWDRKVWRIESGGGGFLLQDPLQPLTALSLDMVRAEQADRLGSYILLASPTKGAPTEWIPLTSGDRKGSGRAVLTLPLGSGESLQLVSPFYHSSPGSRAFDPEGNYGVLARGGEPNAPLTLHVGPPPDPRTATLCVPVKETGNELWISTLQPLPTTLAAEPQGILELLPPGRSAALSGQLRKTADPAFRGSPRLLVLAGPEEYRRLRELEAPADRSSETSPFVWFGIGGALLAAAVFFALLEG